MNDKNADKARAHNRVIIEICSLLRRFIYELKTHTSNKVVREKEKQLETASNGRTKVPSRRFVIADTKKSIWMHSVPRMAVSYLQPSFSLIWTPLSE